MQLEIKKIPIQQVHECSIWKFGKLSIPAFFYGDLIALKSNGKVGCINRITEDIIIPFVYDEISIARNGIIKALYTINDRKRIVFYNINGSEITFYDFINSDSEDEKLYVEEDRIDICCITYEDWDEETYLYSCMSKHILADGKVIEKWGRYLEDEEVASVQLNTQTPYYFEKASDMEILNNNNMLVVEFKFGNAKRHKFFVSEEEADNYLAKFEEDILDKILKF